jgi:hypothetical protein
MGPWPFITRSHTSTAGFDPYASRSYWEEAALEFERCRNKGREELSEGVGERGDGLALYCTPPSPQYESFSTLNVPLNSCPHNSLPLLPHNSAHSVSNSSHHELHTHVYNASKIKHDAHNSEQSSEKIAPVKIHPIMKVTSVKPLDPLYECNDRVGKFLRLLYQSVPPDAIVILNTLYNSCHGDTVIERMMDVIEKHIQMNTLSPNKIHLSSPNLECFIPSGYKDVTLNSDDYYDPPTFDSPDGNPENKCDNLSDKLDFVIPLENSGLLDDGKFNVPPENPDPSNVGLISSRILRHDSKVDIVLSGGGFVTKNSENSESKNLKNFTKNPLIDSPAKMIPKCHQTSFLSSRLPSNCPDPRNRAHVSSALVPPSLDFFPLFSYRGVLTTLDTASYSAASKVIYSLAEIQDYAEFYVPNSELSMNLHTLCCKWTNDFGPGKRAEDLLVCFIDGAVVIRTRELNRKYGTDFPSPIPRIHYIPKRSLRLDPPKAHHFISR